MMRKEANGLPLAMVACLIQCTVQETGLEEADRRWEFLIFMKLHSRASSEPEY